jgi:hypothetical protein
VRSPALPSDRQALLTVLVATTFGLLFLHLATGLGTWFQSGDVMAVKEALGSADETFLGMMAPLELALAGVVLLLRHCALAPARAGGVVLLLLALIDAVALNAHLGTAYGSLLPDSVCFGIRSAQCGKGVADMVVAGVALTLMGQLALNRSRSARALAGYCCGALLGLILIGTLLDLPTSLLDERPGLQMFLDALEEVLEALIAAWALSGCLSITPSVPEWDKKAAKVPPSLRMEW